MQLVNIYMYYHTFVISLYGFIKMFKLEYSKVLELKRYRALQKALQT